MEDKKDFDISKLSLQELIELYNEIISFLNFLEENKIDESEAGNE